jgi:hypothetical protein
VWFLIRILKKDLRGGRKTLIFLINQVNFDKMNQINNLFNRMDAWRHLPNYQLERRADLFFSLYLPEVLEVKLGFPVQDRLIPEFPVRIGTIYPEISSDKSYKIDYVALSVNTSKAIFVELKTQGMSRRVKQDKYLIAAKKVGFPALLEGVLEIFRATNSKRKYFFLLEYLESMGLLQIPMQMKEIISRSILQGLNEASRNIKITTHTTESFIIYVQPNGKGKDIISFEDFRTVVQKHTDLVSQRFAKSLIEWKNTEAGTNNSDIIMNYTIEKTLNIKRDKICLTYITILYDGKYFDIIDYRK